MAAELPYEDLCKVLQEVSKKKDKHEQERLLANFFNEVKINLKLAGQQDCNLFPILRLILPALDRDRSAYNLKETKLGILLVKVLSLAKTSEDAKKLLKFTAVKNTSEGSDFPSIAFYVLKSRGLAKSGNITVREINDFLDKISYAEVGNKAAILDEVFTRMIKSTTAMQAKWFLRIVLKDLKLGMGKTRILAAMHPDAPEYYEACSSLSKVCEELDESSIRPVEMGAELFFALSPMLSERLDVTRAPAVLSNAQLYQIENKFDGERFQMHMKDGKFEYFSRKGFKYSDKFGDSYESSGLLTPLLKDCFDVKANSFILDGEMMGWHKHYECFGSKGMSFDIKKITENSKYRPCYCVYDILYYNGRSFVGTAERGGVPLNERLKILDTLFVEKCGVLMRSQRRIMKDVSEVFQALNDAREKEEEGIVVKQCDSFYVANRRNAGWYKIKPEYTEGSMEDLDLVIVGAVFAENKKQGLARSFYVACAERESPDSLPHRWPVVARVATGLSLEERARVCSLLEPHWCLSSQAPPPPCLHFNKEKPDLWVLPEHSVVLTVRASELIRSSDYGTEYTLRFQRVVRVRDDKPPADVLTLHDYLLLCKGKAAVVKLSNKEIAQGDSEMRVTRRKRTAAPLEVAPQFRSRAAEARAAAGAEAGADSQALRGRKLCVLSDLEDCSKDDLEAIVLKHSGTLVQNISESTWLCIAGRINVRARNAIESNQADVASAAWLRALPPSPDPCPAPSPLHLLAVKEETRQRLARDYDIYGDSYTEDIDEETLKLCFQKMERDNEPHVHLMREEMQNVDRELYKDRFNHPMSFLRPCHIYFKDNESFLALKAKYYGAEIVDLDSPNLTHVVIGPKDIENADYYASQCYRKCLVSPKWLLECFKKKKFVSEIPFELSEYYESVLDY